MSQSSSVRSVYAADTFITNATHLTILLAVDVLTSTVAPRTTALRAEPQWIRIDLNKSPKLFAWKILLSTSSALGLASAARRPIEQLKTDR